MGPKQAPQHRQATAVVCVHVGTGSDPASPLWLQPTHLTAWQARPFGWKISMSCQVTDYFKKCQLLPAVFRCQGWNCGQDRYRDLQGVLGASRRKRSLLWEAGLGAPWGAPGKRWPSGCCLWCWQRTGWGRQVQRQPPHTHSWPLTIAGAQWASTPPLPCSPGFFPCREGPCGPQ